VGHPLGTIARLTKREALVEITTAVRSLRAVRYYSDQEIEPAQVRRWVDTARWTGSSKNSQPWRFVTVRDSDRLEALSRLGEHAGHLEGCAVAVAIGMRPGPHPFATALDLGRVVQSLMLAAHADGVGSCVAVFEPAGNVRRAGEMLGAGDELVIDLAIGFGHADHTAEPAAGPSPPDRLPVDVLLRDERFNDV